jgi:hypothetical protein
MELSNIIKVWEDLVHCVLTHHVLSNELGSICLGTKMERELPDGEDRMEARTPISSSLSTKFRSVFTISRMICALRVCWVSADASGGPGTVEASWGPGAAELTGGESCKVSPKALHQSTREKVI